MLIVIQNKEKIFSFNKPNHFHFYVYFYFLDGGDPISTTLYSLEKETKSRFSRKRLKTKKEELEKKNKIVNEKKKKKKIEKKLFV